MTGGSSHDEGSLRTMPTRKESDFSERPGLLNNDELCYLSAVELASRIRGKELSPVEVTEAVLERIDKVNPALNAICTSMADEARATAQRLEDALMRGQDIGPLGGVPVTVKDIVAVKDSRTTSGSKLFEETISTDDAPAIERLRAAGAVLVGRTSTPEFGWKGVTDNRVFGITRNPWNTDLTPGGSSGGASAAVAAGLGPIGIGTDGGGSIRIPAAFCGLVGHKQSFGRIPNFPATAVDSLRHTGSLTRTVADTALALNVMAGPDERDPASLPAENVDYRQEIERGIEGVRIAYSPDLGYAQVQPEVASICEQAVARFAEAGATVEYPGVRFSDPYDCWNVFFYGGIAAFMDSHFDERGDLLDEGLREVVREGRKLSAVDYVNATFRRNAFWQWMHAFFEDYDLLITPALAVLPFAVGQDNADPLPGQTPRALQWTGFTYPFNLTGQPAASVPCGWSESNLPVGLQIIGRRFDDGTVLRAARALEQLQPWADRKPEIVER
jgi:aspartyl-tRNA(Asn)/glutamyl-tRNA(Gln) amidotransferase subunit A